MAIASLGIKHIVFGVSYESFGLLLPFETETVDYTSLFKQMGVELIMEGPILENDGMKVFEYWGGNYRPLSELLAESAEMKKKNSI